MSTKIKQQSTINFHEFFLCVCFRKLVCMDLLRLLFDKTEFHLFDWRNLRFGRLSYTWESDHE